MTRTTFTQALGDYIVERLWEGATLPQIEREWAEKHPDAKVKVTRQRTHEWSAVHKEFGAAYQEAMKQGAMALLEANIDIADDREDEPASRKVRMEAREKLAARKWPEVCGTNRVHHAGSLNLHHVAELDDATLARIAAGGSAGTAASSGDSSQPE